jgi:transposase
MFQYRQVLVRLREGDSDRAVAQSGLMGRDKTAAFRALARGQGWLEPEVPLPAEDVIAAAVGTARRSPSTVSSATAWQPLIAAWLDQRVQGKAIHAALRRDHGYTGSYSSVHRLIVAIRKTRPVDTTIRLHFEPAEAAQVDFGAGPMMVDATGTLRRTWAFVMTLAFSRHQYVEFVWDQAVETWLGCHRRAFEWFGAVPERVIIDNAKCAITKACHTDPVVQRAYAECALGYGFKIDPCPPHDPQKKGIVEAGVKYVKANFLALRAFRDLPDLNAQARLWVMTEAGLRVHGTTRQPPLTLFGLERPLMRALPPIAPDLGVWHKASLHRDCHLQYQRILYSAPFTLVGQTLWIRITDNAVAVYHAHQHVCTHRKGKRPGERITIGDHLPPHAAAFLAHDREWCLAQAQRVGPACAQLIEHLLSDRILERLRAAQGVLRLADRFTPLRLEVACRRALAHASPFYRTVKTILAGGHDLRLDPNAGIDPAVSYGEQARFARDAADLFTAQPGRLH